MRAYSVCKYWLVAINIIFLAVSGQLAAADESVVRDPTTPLGAALYAGNAGVGVSTYELHSVLISPQRKLAIINGKTLREGQVIPGSAGVQVKRILAQGVVLQQDDKRWELTLAPTTIRKH